MKEKKSVIEVIPPCDNADIEWGNIKHIITKAEDEAAGKYKANYTQRELRVGLMI